jgi:error-prone DNA polymerase
VAGIVLVRQRPGTAKGITFMTLEDESGIANLIVRPAIFERHRKAARHGVVVLAFGRVERQGQVINVIATRLEDLDGQMTELSTTTRNFH